MSALNYAYFSAKGIQTNKALCEGISYGTSIRGSDGESRFFSTWYQTHVTTSSFDLSLVFSTHRAQHRFIEWLRSYARLISDPNGTVGPMVVMIPAYDFHRVAIPVEGFRQADRSGALARHTTIGFEGASDPLKPGQKGTTSQPIIPKDSVVAKFYPTGNQASGAASREDALYNGAPAMAPSDYPWAFGSVGRPQPGAMD